MHRTSMNFFKTIYCQKFYTLVQRKTKEKQVPTIQQVQNRKVKDDANKVTTPKNVEEKTSKKTKKTAKKE